MKEMKQMERSMNALATQVPEEVHNHVIQIWSELKTVSNESLQEAKALTSQAFDIVSQLKGGNADLVTILQKVTMEQMERSMNALATQVPEEVHNHAIQIWSELKTVFNESLQEAKALTNQAFDIASQLKGGNTDLVTILQKITKELERLKICDS